MVFRLPPGEHEPPGWLLAHESEEGSFCVYRTGDLTAQDALRKRIGDEAFADWQRTRELGRNPRPLTSQEIGVLRRTVAPLLADLRASGLPTPDIREEDHEESAAAVCAWIQGPGRTGEGIRILLDLSPAEQVADLAQQIQNWAADQLHDAGLPAGWPACPHHPGPPERLEPEVRDGRAVWACLVSDQVIWPIGGIAIR